MLAAAAAVVPVSQVQEPEDREGEVLAVLVLTVATEPLIQGVVEAAVVKTEGPYTAVVLAGMAL
jgi:hypothetical protein